VPDGDMFLAISEILVHLEILLEDERAELVSPGPPALYRSLCSPYASPCQMLTRPHKAATN